jgi:ParB family chromosome partitioning protein
VLKNVCEKGLNVKKTEDLVERAIERFSRIEKESHTEKKFTKAVKDIRIFINTIRQALDMIKKAGINVKAAQFD